jgi:hypothetical protein
VVTSWNNRSIEFRAKSKGESKVRTDLGSIYYAANLTEFDSWKTEGGIQNY